MSQDLIRREKLYVGLLTGIQFFNILDFVILLPLGPLFMRTLQITPGQFSMLASSYSLSAGIMGLIYSLFADSFDRKKFLLILLSGFIITTLACALAKSFHFLLIARILAGIFGGIITPVVYAIVTDLIPFKRRGRAMGTIMATFSITSIFGIPTGLAIANAWGWRYTFFLISAGAFFASLLIIKLLPSIPVTKTINTATEKLIKTFKLGLQKHFQLPFLLMMTFTASGFLLFPFLSPYAVKNIGISETEIKYIYFIGGIFTVFSSKLTGILTDRYGSMKIFFPALFISLPFIYLYTHIENIKLSSLLIISTGFMVMINLRFIPVMTLLTQSPSINERGAFMAILLSLRSFASALATAFAGYLITENQTGKLSNFDLIGNISICLSLIGLLLFLRLNNNLKKERG